MTIAYQRRCYRYRYYSNVAELDRLALDWFLKLGHPDLDRLYRDTMQASATATAATTQ